MAEAIAIIGSVGALATVIDLVANASSGVVQLKEQWKGANLAVSSLESQLYGLSTALTGIQQWMDGSSGDPHHQLVMGLDQCVNCCALLMTKLDAVLSSYLISPGGQLTRSSKFNHFFKSSAIKDIQRMINHQVATLTVLLAACNA